MALINQPNLQVAAIPAPDAGHAPLAQHPFVRNVVPFLSSLALHAALLAAVFATVKVVMTITRAKQQVVVPTATMVASGSGVKIPGLDGETERAVQNRFPDPELKFTGWAQTPGKTMAAKIFAAESDTAVGAIGVAATAGKPGGKHKVSFNGDSETGAGALAPFGANPRGGGLPAPRGIFNNGPWTGGDGPPPTVIYIIDASGSMVPRFDDVRMELRKAIKGLRTSQSFNVVFFQGSKATALNPSGLMVNNPENREKASKFIENVCAVGETDPIPAIEIALRLNPGMIWLLTDGDFPDNAAVAKFIRDKNPNKRTIVNTIAFVNKGDSYERILQQIASESGGLFRYVSDEDLRR